MMQKMFFCLILLTVIVSCKNKKTAPIQSVDTATKDTTTFYDVNGFLKSEIKDVTETPYYIYTIIEKEGAKRDSIQLKNPEFLQLAQQFLDKDITKPAIKKFYKETVFRDLTTKSITFSYASPNKELEVQGIDVLINEETSKVKYIFMRANKNSGDSSIMTKLNWKAGQSFSIGTTVLKKDGSDYSIQQKVIWNEKDDTND